MDELIKQMIDCAGNRLFYPAIITACALPEICAALESDGTGGRSKYIKWFDTYAAKYYDGELDGHDAYYLRCSILHQGQLSHDRLRLHKTIGFIQPGTWFSRTGKDHTNQIFYLNVQFHCDHLSLAVNEWQNIVKDTYEYKKNYKKFFQRTVTTTGIIGIPIIMSVE